MVFCCHFLFSTPSSHPQSTTLFPNLKIISTYALSLEFGRIVLEPRSKWRNKLEEINFHTNTEAFGDTSVNILSRIIGNS